ncbi:hypothetical protein [Qipengyuania sp. DGS5-3]|uniref:hypothetical protein n=1 Tax=Qipengyuania sp. DGS5-3 TaxID=3349632 RepID=UPI0036D22722
MRPQSIIWFEQLYLTSLAIGAINGALSLSETVAQLNADPAMSQYGFGTGFVIGTMVFSIAINLLLWFLVARKGIEVVKWILVVFLVGGLLFLPSGLATMNMVAAGVALILTAMQFAAVYFLFRPDAKEWFASLRGEPIEKPERGVDIK